LVLPRSKEGFDCGYLTFAPVSLIGQNLIAVLKNEDKSRLLDRRPYSFAGSAALSSSSNLNASEQHLAITRQFIIQF
jgi:hypothetical protein